MTIFRDGFRFGFFRGDTQLAAPHPQSGILIDGASLKNVKAEECDAARCKFSATTAVGMPVAIQVKLTPADCAITVTPAKPASIVLRTRGMNPSFGLGDRAAAEHHDDTDLTGLVDDHLLAGMDFTRLASNFIIFPRQHMAEVVVWPEAKIVHLTHEENAQGVTRADRPVTAHYFFGSPHEIYSAFADVRRQAGYPVLMPKYEMFGVGWEAFGALAWDTNQTTVRESVDRYRSLGYPLQWMVVGSGFWPNEPDSMHETTSFGLWDKARYPNPKAFIQYFHDEKMKVLLGLRITFITTGPFAEEGARRHYFLEEDGKPKVFNFLWPHLPSYLLNTQSTAAVDWYLGLVEKWKDAGVDGFKEDFFGYKAYDLRDDKLDPVSNRLMALGYDLIERNGYLSSNGDLQRLDDFNYNQDQDRGPVNALSLAYSGLPLVYPDIVGGTFGENHFNLTETPAMDAYMMRNAQWAALHPAMSMGQPPWSFRNPQVGEVMRKAAQIHERLHPYLYSQAVRFVHDGYPWTMTPLSVAYPEDPGVYGRENKSVRGYEWMIGDALLAAPVYGADYATAQTRDVYLPAGTWMDYESGARFNGPVLLPAYSIPVAKTPLFVGGSGIVMEQVDGAPVARVYPIKKNAHTELWFSDGRTSSSIDLNIRDWKNVTVTDTTTGARVESRLVRFAIQFAIVAGHSYRVA